MHLPDWLKSPLIVFVCAWAIFLFGVLSLVLAWNRFHSSHHFDGGFVLGALFVVWGLWALLFHKWEE